MNKNLLREIYRSQKNVVPYQDNGLTRCPVCDFFGFEHSKTMVAHTAKDGIRYMSCTGCTANFVAYRDEEKSKQAKADETIEKQIKESKLKKQKSRRKNTTKGKKKAK